jgi:hypothetical protein
MEMKKFNEKLAILIVNSVSTMSCAYIFAIIALIILLGQNLLNKSAEARANIQFDAVMEIVQDVRVIIKDVQEDHDNVMLILSDVQKLLTEKEEKPII